MTPRFEENDCPSPELLAAYVDGEFEGRDDLVVLRRRIESWLSAHPESQTELAELRRLRQIWQSTTPCEPSEAAWNKVVGRISEVPFTQNRPRPIANGRRRKALVLAIAASIAVVMTLRATWPVRTSPTSSDPIPAVEPFQVANSGDVEILRIDGDDVASLVVGQLPVKGPLELAKQGEVQFTSMPPDMVQTAPADSTGTPMVYPSGGVDVKP